MPVQALLTEQLAASHSVHYKQVAATWPDNSNLCTQEPNAQQRLAQPSDNALITGIRC